MSWMEREDRCTGMKESLSISGLSVDSGVEIDGWVGFHGKISSAPASLHLTIDASSPSPETYEITTRTPLRPHNGMLQAATVAPPVPLRLGNSLIAAPEQGAVERRVFEKAEPIFFADLGGADPRGTRAGCRVVFWRLGCFALDAGIQRTLVI